MSPTTSDEGTPRGVHPDHDAVRVELRSWFTSSEPVYGYVVTKRPYGYLSEPGGVFGPRLILTIDDPGDVPQAIGDATDRSDGPLVVWVEGRARCARLDRSLQDAGCKPVKSVTHLALVGELSARPGPASLTSHDVDLDGLEEWAVTKLMCFGDTEEPPAADRVASELAVRTPDLALARLQLGRLDGIGVAVMAYYEGADQLVFNLGTRVPFRHRGIAQELLGRWVAAGRASGCRSLMINADHLGAPEALYRRIGFVDEIYWYQQYVWGPRPS